MFVCFAMPNGHQMSTTRGKISALENKNVTDEIELYKQSLKDWAVTGIYKAKEN